jgi:hypothetical protein
VVIAPDDFMKRATKAAMLNVHLVDDISAL